MVLFGATEKEGVLGSFGCMGFWSYSLGNILSRRGALQEKTVWQRISPLLGGWSPPPGTDTRVEANVITDDFSCRQIM